MTDKPMAPLYSWLIEPMSRDAAESVERLRRAEDVRHVAVMPDVHLAIEVCIGVVVATESRIYPAAVGGDIGCGMAAVAFQMDAAAFDNERSAAKVLAGLYEGVPANKHRKGRSLPASLESSLSDARLNKLAARDGSVQLGTIGRGNHFLEFQSDEEGRLWVMVHTGSRAMGQAITEHHARLASASDAGPAFLDVADRLGSDYLHDAEWARRYANENRMAILTAVEELIRRLFGAEADGNTRIHRDHNHVQRESHFGCDYWVHRKGAQSASAGEEGIVPGSMGAASFHTIGRGEENSLRSCSHGAGRKLSRTEARQAIGRAEFDRQVGRVWYDHRLSNPLREEAPSAYKDVRAVMKAQRELIKIVRELRPILSYKGV